MKIALLMGPRDVQIQEQPVPVPGPGEVRLKVAAAGVCGTDVDAYKGHQPKGWTITYPFRMGHELSAVVDEVGDGVDAYQPGDRVTVDGRLPCGVCSQCRRGYVNACINAGYTSGGFMEYSIYPQGNLVRIPEGVSLLEAAFAEPLSCCLYGSQKLDVRLGDFAVVMGEGAIGLLHAQLLKNRGAEVAVVGLIPERLEAAEDLGIDHVINAREVDPVERIMELTGGLGANVVICAAGAEVVLRQALDMAARFGQILYFAANLKDQVCLELDLVHYKELTMVGSYDSTTAYFEQALRLMQMGAVNVKRLITHTLPLDKAAEGFEAAENMTGLKVMIVNE